MNSIQFGFSILNTAFSAVLSWFSLLLEKDNFGSYLMAAIFIVFSYRFILTPVLDKGSDFAKKNIYSKSTENFEKY